MNQRQKNVVVVVFGLFGLFKQVNRSNSISLSGRNGPVEHDHQAGLVLHLHTTQSQPQDQHWPALSDLLDHQFRYVVCYDVHRSTESLVRLSVRFHLRLRRFHSRKHV